MKAAGNPEILAEGIQQAIGDFEVAFQSEEALIGCFSRAWEVKRGVFLQHVIAQLQ
jgi:hypothetical protein